MAPINLGAGPVDAVFVEALHQFQMNCYKDSKQHDGLAGASVLDSLGFWPRKGLRSSSQTNQWAKDQVRSRAESIDKAIAGTPPDLARDLSAKNWWISFVNPCFLGRTFARPIHVYFARKLRKAELWLLSQPRFAGKTPVELAELLDINENHAGGRNNAGSKSSHTLGLAIDVKYLGNPHVGDYRDKPIGAKRFSEVMKRAAARISGTTLAEEKFPAYLHTLGNDAGKTTSQIYEELTRRDQDLRQYLALPEASADLAALRQGVFKGSQERDPLNGFLNLDRDLVIALRDHACLVWGAVDFGSGANGDIMHFDCRLDDIGRAVYCRTGGTFNDKHPCWNRSEPPCPPPPSRPRRSRRAPSRAAEVLESECEDEYAAASEFANEDDEFSQQLDETQELTDSQDSLYEAREHQEDLLETEVPPLLKDPAQSNPPGQTLYLNIKLGKDSRCVKWIKENGKKKCVEYTSFWIRPMTGIFIPENYSTQSSVDLILYLHGHKTAIPGSDALISEYWNAQKYPIFALREEINASRKNVILVVPTLGLKSEAGNLMHPNGLDKYLEQVIEALKTYGPYKDQSPSIGGLILAAHSGGGVYMRRLATSSNRAAGNIRECWGFDSLYNSSDVRPWRLWAKNDPQTRRLYSYYRKGLPKINSESLEKDESGQIDKLPNIFPVRSSESDHFKLVRLHLHERLEGAAFLGNIAPRPRFEQFFDEAEDEDYLPDYEDDSSMEFEDEDESDLDLEEFEDQTTQLPTVLDLALLLDDLQTPIGEKQIIGLDGGANLNIQLSVSDIEATDRTHVDVELLIRTPGKPREKIVTRVLKVPKKGPDPNDPSKVFYQLSILTTEVAKILSPLDKVKEVATVRRIGGTSDGKLIRALGSGWQLRGQAEQADKCGISSDSFADERPDAFKLFQSGGVAILEISDLLRTKSIKRFIRNPADIVYYTGHGLGVGFSQRVSAPSPLNCLAIEDHVSATGYCCWLNPSDLTPVWKSPMDLDILIIAGCSVLAVDVSTGSVLGDGLEWAKLTQAGGGPLIALLGYGDWDANENDGQGPMGATAPWDHSGGDAIATEMGNWIRSNPLKGIIRAWLTINMSHQNPFGVGFDNEGFCWRTRRKSTPGWKVQARLITKDKIHYVIEKLKVI